MSEKLVIDLGEASAFRGHASFCFISGKHHAQARIL